MRVFSLGRVLDVTTSKLDNTEVTYTAEKIHERCRIIALAWMPVRNVFPRSRDTITSHWQGRRTTTAGTNKPAKP